MVTHRATNGKTFVSPMMGCWRLFDPKLLTAVAAFSAKKFYCVQLPFKPILGGDRIMQQGMGCSALKISKIDKTPTPHHRKNAALLKGAIDLVRSLGGKGGKKKQKNCVRTK